MIVVIIAGGSGSRLWPLSTPNYPKHLLKVGGDKFSLLQNTYKRAKLLSDEVYVISESSHIKYVKEQLNDLDEANFIVEPGRRGTANCILLALSYIADRHPDNDNESIAFMHADHYIRDTLGFVGIFRLADKLAVDHQQILLVGVEPDHPATGFGYIEKGDAVGDQAFVNEVKSFKEKPDFTTARRYVSSGRYIWNGGYFVAPINVFRKTIADYAPDLDRNYEIINNAKDNLEDVYLSLHPEAIDYALIEKVPNLLVISAAFDWIDLGSYADLAKTIGGDEKGNYVSGQRVKISDVTNSYINNQEDKPVVVIGLDNVVVANTPSGLLIARKDLSQKVGDISKEL
jgi:mannose-1-phosphate guanylyltransferase